ncbi:ABC transporter permease subunit [Allomesorhizobium camelthorni]|uniref:ABC transporter permease subunit n=1 Tax=Allomesorhizobium camelthorni TaxID=475069 RepID=A0A6G4WL68_9HYPH|nr:ABC transporter permease subunit [Mesorhizobium camelthorni]NGO55349.1 ABC transporter permease subunit [Mesorhizobium camelthorni]
METFDFSDPFQMFTIPVGEWASEATKWIVTNFRYVFQNIKLPIDFILSGIEAGLRGCPPLVFIGCAFLLAWQVAGMRTAVFVAAALFAIGSIGAWPEAMTTLAIVLTAVFFCCVTGIPLGILAAQNDLFEKVLRPALDFLQTIPSFVYLVPIVMLFGIGNVSGVIVTIIYALAPVVRLTNLGIRQVREDLVEASTAFGASRLQTLLNVQLPLARPAIMTGVNQTIMLSLSMSVIASMISVTGLGQMVLRGIGRLDIALATTGGLGIVLTAMVIDRISQGLGRSARDRAHKGWKETGPVGAVRRLMALIPASRTVPARLPQQEE